MYALTEMIYHILYVLLKLLYCHRRRYEPPLFTGAITGLLCSKERHMHSERTYISSAAHLMGKAFYYYIHASNFQMSSNLYAIKVKA